MRLTLRTLLAYLDDLLEPSQAKELGAKIQESEAASQLVMQIRDVIRKRRLTAPVVSGPGCDLDANLVAEYLDNTLSPEGVIDVERICLESDMHLAEVAASHQILTLVLGEPVDVGQASRERMYALGEAARTAGHSVTATVPLTGLGAAVVAKPSPVAPASVAASGLNPAVKPVAGSRLQGNVHRPAKQLLVPGTARGIEDDLEGVARLTGAQLQFADQQLIEHRRVERRVLHHRLGRRGLRLGRPCPAGCRGQRR